MSVMDLTNPDRDLKSWGLDCIRSLRDAWAHRPEGAAGTPWLYVKMTPAAAAVLMERMAISSLDAVVVREGEALAPAKEAALHGWLTSRRMGDPLDVQTEEP